MLFVITGCSSGVNGTNDQAKTPVPVNNDANPNVKGKTVTFNMTAKKFVFEPAKLEVKKGDTVVISITSTDATHGFALPDFNINESIAQGETRQIKFVVDKAGTFGFRCSIPCGPGHSEMTGEIVVTE